MANDAVESSLSAPEPAQPDISERHQDNRDAALHLLYQEVKRLREELAAKKAARDEEVAELREALRRQVERVTAMSCADAIMGRALAAGNSGPVPVVKVNGKRPAQHREPPPGWRVINGGVRIAF